MKKIIGGIILAMVFAFLVIVTCVAYGWKVGLITWTIALILTFIVLIAMYLITEDE